MDVNNLSNHAILGPLIPIILAVGITSVIMTLGKIFIKPIQKAMLEWSKKTNNQWDDDIYLLLIKTRPSFLGIWLLYIISQALLVDFRFLSLVKTLTIIFSAVQLAIWAIQGVRLWRDQKMTTLVGTDPSNQAPVKLITSVIEALIVIIIILMGLSNLGIDIGALITGLGIGGVAVALAAQNILGDLFASFSIIFDKPFLVGDHIQVGKDSGTVQHIGLKTTRVESSTGEQLIFSNKDLLESRIRNFKRMKERRAAIKIRIDYETPVDQLRQIPIWTEEILKTKPNVRFEYCRFIEIGEYAHVFEIVFWMLDPTYNLYLLTQENFYHEFLSKLHTEKIKLGVPVHSVSLTNA
jgi:small-conductance mechanosensitive channel